MVFCVILMIKMKFLLFNTNLVFGNFKDSYPYILIEEPVKKVTEEDIGKLCWVWDDDEDLKTVDILSKILLDHTYTFSCRVGCYKHCRRVTSEEVAKITGYKVEELQ